MNLVMVARLWRTEKNPISVDKIKNWEMLPLLYRRMIFTLANLDSTIVSSNADAKKTLMAICYYFISP